MSNTKNSKTVTRKQRTAGLAGGLGAMLAALAVVFTIMYLASSR